MRLPDVLSAEERSKRWWIGWRSVDVSWASLERKYLSTDAEQEKRQTLQGYWRTDPAMGIARNDDILTELGELQMDPCGNLWHLVHVPLHWDDGTPTWKAERYHESWQLFWKLIRERLKAANGHALGGEPSDEESDVANLSGVVFGDVPDDWLWHSPLDRLNAKFQTCAFLGRVSFYGVESTSELDLRHCLFTSTADFDAVNIERDLRLDRAVFPISPEDGTRDHRRKS